HAKLRLQPFAMRSAEKQSELKIVVLSLQSGHVEGLDRPAGFTKKRGGIDRPRDCVQHPAIRQAEITRHIAALLLAIVDAKRSDFLKRRDEVRFEVFADLIISQGVLTERLGVVSCETGVVEITGNMQQKH